MNNIGVQIGYVYKAINKINDKVYIGQTVNLEKRKIQHIAAAIRGSRSGWGCRYFHNALRKYGESNFEWHIVEKVEADTYDELKKRLCGREQRHIRALNSDHKGSGYNLTPGGENPPIISSLPNAKEIYKRIAEKSSRRMMGCGNQMYGKRQSEGHKKKISQALMGKKVSSETIKRMSANAIGKSWEERYGTEVAEQMRIKKSLATKAQTNFHSKLSAEDVEIILANKNLYSRKDLAKKFGIHYSHLYRILSGECSHYSHRMKRSSPC